MANFSSTPKHHSKSTLLVITGLVVIYLASYGLVRWRRILVRSFDKNGIPCVIVPGHRGSESWKSRVCNSAAPACAVMFAPLMSLEGPVRGEYHLRGFDGRPYNLHRSKPWWSRFLP